MHQEFYLSRAIRSEGFTIVELLVVVAISALLSGLAIAYSHVGQNAVAVSVEEGKIGGVFLQAKQLAVATYGAHGVCGYGVVVNANATPQTYSIFAYTPPLSATGACPAPATVQGATINGVVLSAMETQYTPDTWNIVLPQDVRIALVHNGIPYPYSLWSVLFYPPDPTTYLSHDNQGFTPGVSMKVYLESSDGGTASQVTISPDGQISF